MCQLQIVIVYVSLASGGDRVLAHYSQGPPFPGLGLRLGQGCGLGPTLTQTKSLGWG